MMMMMKTLAAGLWPSWVRWQGELPALCFQTHMKSDVPESSSHRFVVLLFCFFCNFTSAIVFQSGLTKDTGRKSTLKLDKEQKLNLCFNATMYLNAKGFLLHFSHHLSTCLAFVFSQCRRSSGWSSQRIHFLLKTSLPQGNGQNLREPFVKVINVSQLQILRKLVKLVSI